MTDTKKRIGVIFGGKSSECEISLATGRYIYHLLDPQLFTGIPIYMDKKGLLWVIPEKLVIMNRTDDVEAKLGTDAKRIRYEDLPQEVDLIFNGLLGKYGEDGIIQGVLELIGVPYTGSGILASAVGMNKKVHKELLTKEGFLCPKDVLVNKSNVKSQMLKTESEIGFPCVVKPVCEGSSVGVTVAKKGEELEKAIESAFYWDPEVLVEEFIIGREFMCVVWGNEDPEAMLPTEVVFEGEIHTYESKYMPGKAQYHTPIRVPEEVVKEIQRQAVAIYNLIGAKGYGRVDGFVVEPEDKSDISGYKIYIGEPHTGTIMVPSSYVFQQAAKTKVETKTQVGKKTMPVNPRLLVTKIIEMAEEAHQTKKGYL